MQKCPRNCTMNKKSSNFVKKWTKFQTKAQKCSKVHFIREIWCSNREIGRFDEKLGDSQENRESWQVFNFRYSGIQVFSSADTTAPQNGHDPVNQNFRPIRTGKMVHLKRSTSFIETFPVGPNFDPLSFAPKFPEILFECFAPIV